MAPMIPVVLILVALASVVGPDKEALQIQSNEAAVSEAANEQSIAVGRPLSQEEWDAVRAKVVAERNVSTDTNTGKVGE